MRQKDSSRAGSCSGARENDRDVLQVVRNARGVVRLIQGVVSGVGELSNLQRGGGVRAARLPLGFFQCPEPAIVC